MAEASYGSLPFTEQVEFFRKKINLPTATWRDIRHNQHDVAFVVAGATRDDLLTDLRRAVDKAISQGTTLAEFRKDFDALVKRHGWTGWTGEGSDAGRAWRTRVIYETNLRTSYAAGRLAQMQAVADTRPYWRYRHTPGDNPRVQHLAWDGLVLRHDDPWWDIHYPPNAWGCGCYVETLAARDMERLGRTGPDTAPTAPDDTSGIGDGWAYMPGKGRTAALTPNPLDELPRSLTPAAPNRPDMPTPRRIGADGILPEGLGDQDYVDAFLAEFGLDATAGERVDYYEDVAGEVLLISDALFRERGGEIKIGKRERARYLPLIAQAIQSPDEIWQDWGAYGDKTVLRRRYVARWIVEGMDVPALAVFETGPSGWAGVTAFAAGDEEYINRRVRRGERVWARE